MANYLKINNCDAIDGPGVRVTLFVTGCRNHCKGCHNPETWDFSAGESLSEEVAAKIIAALDHSYVAGLTLCGGEPMEPENQAGLVDLVKAVKMRFPDKTIWCYTGYELTDLLIGGDKHCDCTMTLLSYIDVLITGRYIEAQRDITKANLWRGSRNQRVIDLKKTLAAGRQINLAGIPNND